MVLLNTVPATAAVLEFVDLSTIPAVSLLRIVINQAGGSRYTGREHRHLLKGVEILSIEMVLCLM